MDFMGYIRPDGSVGTRNHILVISCGTKTDRIAFNVSNTVEQTKAVYCGSFGQYPISNIVTGLVGNPNAAGAIILQSDAEPETEQVKDLSGALGKPVEIIDVNNCGGTMEAMFKATRRAAEMVREMSAQKRQAVSVSRLVTGLLHVDDERAQDPMKHYIASMVNNHSRFLAFTQTGDKNEHVFGHPVTAKTVHEQNLPKAQGVYVITDQHNAKQAILSMILAGVQVIVSNTGSLYQNQLLPVINIVTDHNKLKSLPDDLELELIVFEDQYNEQDYSLLIVNEVLATASGKLTKAEILKS